jgi:hemerythrin
MSYAHIPQDFSDIITIRFHKGADIMEWTEDLSVGVKEVDDQHKELIRRMNAFFTAIEMGYGNEEVLRVLEFLGSYVATHFRDEESLQVRCNFPRYAEHRALHKGFIEDIKKIKQDIQESGFTVMTKTLMGSTLTTWLVLHISKEDKAIGSHMRSRGLMK